MKVFSREWNLGRRSGAVMAALSFLFVICALSMQRSSSAAAGTSSLVRGVPSDARRVELAGHLQPMAQSRFDVGPVPATFPMVELKLVLRRSADQDTALEKLLTAQQTPGSPQYHKWLKPEDFGAQFGAGDQDLQAAKAWLESHSFKVGNVAAGRRLLPFTGTAAQVEAAFQTPIHYFVVDGVKHFANIANPQIPAALQPLVSGIRGLHDFRPKSGSKTRVVSTADLLLGSGNYVGPGDYALIYNFVPLSVNGVHGEGVKVAVAAQSDINVTIPASYWSAFGVASGQQVSSVAAAAATDPGRTGNGDETEAYVDVEIIGSLAPHANIIVVRDMDVTTALDYAIDQNLAGVVNVSFSACEQSLGSANASIKSAFQQAVAQGITVVVSAGDNGIAECEATRNTAGYTVTGGLSVNGLASTPYDIAVGGTDFDPVLVRLGSYWDSSNSSPTFANAKSYLPEMVWNSSCANPITATSIGASSSLTLCNMPAHASLDRVTGAGGGLSSCTSVTTAGTCASGYAAPTWQTGVPGISGFTARAIPDVSMLANNWVACDQNAASCGTTSKSVEIFNGTSVAAPGMSALVALLDEVLITSSNTDGRVGNLNPTLYKLATAELGSASTPNSANLTKCNSSNGAAVPQTDTCIFNDVTAGSNAQPCRVSSYAAAASRPLSVCASASGDTYGIVEASSSAALAYSAGAGYDLASGLGTLNAALLVEGIAGLQAPSDLTATGGGTSVTLTWTGLAQAKTYNIYVGTDSGEESTTPVQTGITGTTATVTGLQSGQTYYFYVTATTAAGETYPSTEANLILVPATPTGLATAGTATTITLSWNAAAGADSYEVFEGSSPGDEAATPVATGISGTSYSMAGTLGTTAYFTVVAVNEGGDSAASSEAIGSVLPASPTGLTASGASASVTLTWTAAAGASSYNVYEGTGAGQESAAVTSNVKGTSATISGLAAGTTYYFVVKSVNPAGVSTPSNEASAATTAAAGGKSGGGSFELLDLVLGSLLVLGRFSARSGRLCGSTRTKTTYAFRSRRSNFR